jgi:hypothetical protein
MATKVTRFSISPDICSSSNNDGSIVLDVKRGVLYSIIGVGSLICAKLTAYPEGLTLDDIVSLLQADFTDISQEQIKRDAEKLLSQLDQEGIIEASDSDTKRKATGGPTLFDNVATLFAHMTIRLALTLKLTTIAAFIDLVLVDLTLKLQGFRALHQLVKRWPAGNRISVQPKSIREICAAVDRATSMYPKHALCLQRSVVTTCLLRTGGVHAKMVIACRKVPFKGHAWVEVDGNVINDNQKVQALYSSVLESC